MRAHASRSLAPLDEADACFAEASRCFVDASDIERQNTYLLQALVEGVRLGGTLTEAQRTELICLVDEAPVEALSGTT